MTQAGDEQHQALVRRAQEILSAGASADAAFVELAADGGYDLRAIAIAVSMAAGTSLVDAEKRWAEDGEAALEEVEGDPEELGWLLAIAGFFDFHRPLDEREQQVRTLLNQALRAHGGWRSGHFGTITRHLEAGQLHDALESMAGSSPRTFAPRSRPAPSTYWTRLVEAAELLAADGDDGRLAEIAALCRRHLDELPPADPGAGG